MRKLLVPFAIFGLLVALFPISASATVHEIVAQWCAGRGELLPPGITGESSADNFAQPLFASGFATVVAPFDPPGAALGPGVLIAFDFDHPASKIVGTGEFAQIDTLPDGTPVYVEVFELDTGHGFAHCKRLRS